MTLEIDFTRLEKLGSLKSGGHKGPDNGACVMEAVAYIAGEKWSDHPQCVSPVIGAFLRNWNDSLPSDADRDRLLKPLIPKIINTRADDATEERRSYLALDWMIRTYLPAWLRFAKLEDEADKVAALAPIADMETATAAAPVVQAANTKAAAARDAARDAAWDAAWAAAWAAAGAAAGDAAWDAAGDAAGAAAWDAAWDAAWAAAWAAAGAAAGDAAWDAAWDALAPTRDALQLSAVDLVERMAALKGGA
jgi:hypothetical protein